MTCQQTESNRMRYLFEYLHSVCVVFVLYGAVWSYVALIPVALVSWIPVVGSTATLVVRVLGWYLLCSLITRCGLVYTVDQQSGLPAIVVFLVTAIVLLVAYSNAFSNARSSEQEDLVSGVFDDDYNSTKRRQLVDLVIMPLVLIACLIGVFVPAIVINSLTNVAANAAAWVMGLPVVGWILGLVGAWMLVGMVFSAGTMAVVLLGLSIGRLGSKQRHP